VTLGYPGSIRSDLHVAGVEDRGGFGFGGVRLAGQLCAGGGIVRAAAAAVGVAAGATHAVDESTIYPILLIEIVAMTACLGTFAASRRLPNVRLRLSNALPWALGVVALASGVVTDVWFLTVGGIYSVLLGTLLVAVSMLIAGWLRRLYGTVAIAEWLAMFVANTENRQIWLMVPFGAAWLLVGHGLWTLTLARLTPAS
jgi:hypothetical protein